MCTYTNVSKSKGSSGVFIGESSAYGFFRTSVSTLEKSIQLRELPTPNHQHGMIRKHGALSVTAVAEIEDNTKSQTKNPEATPREEGFTYSSPGDSCHFGDVKAGA